MLLESLRLAVEALGRNVVRSCLTALGVLIGVAAVIAMITIGRGASENVKSEIAKLGAELITLSVGQQMRGGQGATVTAASFDYGDVDAIRTQIRGLRHVAPLATEETRVSAGGKNWSTKAIGTENDYFAARGWPLARGRLFSEAETYNGKPVCVIGETVRQKLYGDGDGEGQALRLGSMPCTVIGVLSARGQAGLAEDDDNIVAIPFDAFQRRIQGSSDIASVVLAAYPSTSLERLKINLVGLMRERRGLSAGEPDDFTVLDMRQVAQSMAAATQTLTLFLGAIAAVSLLVGGIGIMNIMLVSVTERTREIGVRLAIGALPSQIRSQFLLEAVLISGIGAFSGVVIGLGAAALAAPALAIPFVLDPLVVIVTVAISTLLGIGFGYAPASKAAGLDPVEALRHA